MATVAEDVKRQVARTETGLGFGPILYRWHLVTMRQRKPGKRLLAGLMVVTRARELLSMCVLNEEWKNR